MELKMTILGKWNMTDMNSCELVSNQWWNLTKCSSNLPQSVYIIIIIIIDAFDDERVVVGGFLFFSKVVQEIRLKCCYKTHMNSSKYSLTDFLVYKLSTMKSIRGQMLCCIESVIWAKPEWICFSILVANCFACIRFDDTLATGTNIHRRIEK